MNTTVTATFIEVSAAFSDTPICRVWQEEFNTAAEADKALQDYKELDDRVGRKYNVPVILESSIKFNVHVKEK